MKLIADSGSTKTDWLLKDDNNDVLRFSTPGINPVHLAEEDIMLILRQMVKVHPQMQNALQIEFYGSGCTEQYAPLVKKCLHDVFGEKTKILVASDIVGAAKAVCGREEGIACILGTGANSCLWNGTTIVCQTPALGYILGDEGSGAVLGRMLINALYKGALPESLREDFETEYAVDMKGVIERVYRQPLANRWLASLSPFVKKHINVTGVEQLVLENLNNFIIRNVMPYRRPDLPVSFVGSISCNYEAQLRKVAETNGIKVGTIVKSPIVRF